MIRFVGLAFVAILGAWLASWALSKQGYVGIQLGGWLVETSVSVLLLMLVVGMLAVFGFLRLGVWLMQLPSQWRQWRANRRLRAPIARMTNSVHALALTDTSVAVDRLAEGKDDSQWLRVMLAAQLAHASGHKDKRDAFLAQALKLAPDQGFTIRLLKARWLMNEDTAQALGIVDDLLVAHPRQRTLKSLKAQALADLGQWSALEHYLPTAKGALSRGQFLEMRGQLLSEQLMQASHLSELNERWHKLTKAEQKQTAVVSAFVSRARLWQPESKDYWGLLAQSMNVEWSAVLLPLLAQLSGNEPYIELKQVEQWLKKHDQEAGLWWLAGVLSQRLGLVSQARHQFQQSLALSPSVPAALALSDLLASGSQPEESRQVLRRVLAGQETQVPLLS